MCISLPARVLSVFGLTADVEVNGLKRQILLAVDGVKSGDWVLIYGGAALSVMEPNEALESSRLLERLRTAS